MTKLNAALDLAARGFKVFPLIPNGKLPLLMGDWREHAASDPAKIKALWRDRDCNIGVWCENLLVMDFDITKGDGMKDLADFAARGIDCSAKVRTASGGIHVYLRTPAGVAVANSVRKVAPNTDIRGTGGYVVGPGSVIDGRAYEWI